jgi:hypothetical protein
MINLRFAALKRCATLVVVVASMAAAQDGGQWRSLFDGKTTAGWRGYRQKTMPEGWQAVDGALTRVGKGGDIVTVDQFGDFELSLEWKIAPGGNSGVKYLVTEDRSGPIAHEYQVIDDARHEDAKLGANRTTGALYDAIAPVPNKPLKPAGEINSSRIVVNGMHVEHWLNGVQVVGYELGSPALKAAKANSKFKDEAGWGTKLKGHILLQDHGDEVWFRNMRIKDLPPSTSTSSK